MGRCYFQLRDAASLGAATERLAKARACLQRSHGPNLERIKVLHGDFSPELATCAHLLSLSLLKLGKGTCMLRSWACLMHADHSGRQFKFCPTIIAHHVPLCS